MKTLSVLLVEDSTLFRSALMNTFLHNKSFSLSLCTSSLFLKRMEKIDQDVVIIDAVTWAGSLDTLIDAVRRAAQLRAVVLLGRDDLFDKHLQVLRAGALGFVKQTASPRVVAKAVKAVANGEVWFERDVFLKVFVQAHPADTWPAKISLNSREKQILAFVASGKTNKEIGTQLGLTERNVKAYVANLLRKIGAANRSSLTSYAILHGIMPLSPNMGN